MPAQSTARGGLAAHDPRVQICAERLRYAPFDAGATSGGAATAEVAAGGAVDAAGAESVTTDTDGAGVATGIDGAGVTVDPDAAGVDPEEEHSAPQRSRGSAFP